MGLPSPDRRRDSGGLVRGVIGDARREDRDKPQRYEAEDDDQSPRDRDAGGVGGGSEGERRKEDRGAGR